MSKYKKSNVMLVSLLALMLVAVGQFSSPLFVDQAMADDTAPPDHSAFPKLQEEFAIGPDVTAACLQYHPSEGSEVMMTTHWIW